MLKLKISNDLAMAGGWLEAMSGGQGSTSAPRRSRGLRRRGVTATAPKATAPAGSAPWRRAPWRATGVAQDTGDAGAGMAGLDGEIMVVNHG